MGRRTAIILSIAWFACASPGFAQGGPGPRPMEPEASSAWLRFDEPAPFAALLTWFPPYFIAAETGLKDFIRTPEFDAWRRFAGDARAVDAIWVRAMALTANNTSLALLAATLATFDHEVVGLRIPALALYFPLTGESSGDFAARVRNLPASFYPDSPPGGHGDRDKLQHFFGSAWIAFTFESRGAAARVGNFVEEGEDAVIVDGVLDDRDARANWNGSEFGAALLAHNRIYPSSFFHAPLAGAGRTTSAADGAPGGWPAGATGRFDAPEGCR